MENTGITRVEEEFSNLGKEFHTLKEEHEIYLKKLEELKSLQARCMSKVNHQQKRYKLLLSALNRKGLDLSGEDQVKVNELKKNIQKNKSDCQEVTESLPKPNSTFLSVILGRVSVSLLTRADRLSYKEEYERFKLNLSLITQIFAILLYGFIELRLNYKEQYEIFKLYLSLIVFVVSLLQSFVSGIRFIDAIFHFLLVWYYCTLVIRESILRHNGSRIKGWWVTHHYLSVVLSLTLLIWPDSVTYKLFRSQFMMFSMYMSFVQLLQYYYQSGCLYRLRALGEKRDMDITVEGFQRWMWRGLQFILPFLYLTYIFQLYNAYKLFELSRHPQCEEWMVGAAGTIFLLLFIGNFTTTSRVVLEKSRKAFVKNK
ncbi:transmembrane protein 120A-like isoform X1 [Anneissia japonica]|uniref:transmembrane protein 120A-like isoform X1 n=1 Tax=Anneissia japonica TaxID=1529436 RepID=UPI001425B671|nr:transmembrane protein 120A-like isoform X1 [Anneissia japonica]